MRKLGKLPAEVVSVSTSSSTAWSLAITPTRSSGRAVLIVDDLLATGGTVAGTIDLVKQLKGEIVGLAFLIELTALHGRDRLAGYEIATLLWF